MASRLTFEEAHRFLQLHPEAVLVDVREEAEYITGHARDAELLPVDELDAESADLVIGTKDTPVLVYCRTGRRSRAETGRTGLYGSLRHGRSRRVALRPRMSCGFTLF